MIRRIFVLLSATGALLFFSSILVALAAADPAVFLEPGPNFTQWILVDTKITKLDIDLIFREYRHSENKNQIGFTHSIKIAGEKEKLLLKVWGIEKTSDGRDIGDNVESVLHLPNGDWFVGDRGEYPDIYMELGLFGYNFVIHVKKFEQKWYQKCLEDEKRGVQENCGKFFSDKTYNGMYISIPVRKYNK